MEVVRKRHCKTSSKPLRLEGLVSMSSPAPLLPRLMQRYASDSGDRKLSAVGSAAVLFGVSVVCGASHQASLTRSKPSQLMRALIDDKRQLLKTVFCNSDLVLDVGELRTVELALN